MLAPSGSRRFKFDRKVVKTAALVSGDHVAVVGKGTAPDQRIAGEGRESGSGFQVPDLESVVPRRRRGEAPVRTHRNPGNRVGVTGEGVQCDSIFQNPNLEVQS